MIMTTDVEASQVLLDFMRREKISSINEAANRVIKEWKGFDNLITATEEPKKEKYKKKGALRP